MFYFCGHGCEALSASGDTDSYLIPADERGITDYHMQATAISVCDIMAGFGHARCSLAFLVLDVCTPYPLSRHVPLDECVPSALGNIVVKPEDVLVSCCAYYGVMCSCAVQIVCVLYLRRF